MSNHLLQERVAPEDPQRNLLLASTPILVEEQLKFLILPRSKSRQPLSEMLILSPQTWTERHEKLPVHTFKISSRFKGMSKRLALSNNKASTCKHAAKRHWLSKNKSLSALFLAPRINSIVDPDQAERPPCQEKQCKARWHRHLYRSMINSWSPWKSRWKPSDIHPEPLKLVQRPTRKQGMVRVAPRKSATEWIRFSHHRFWATQDPGRLQGHRIW